MFQLNQLIEQHEATLQQRRLERASEDRALDKLKTKLQKKVREQQQQKLQLTRASA
jgi:hypothetical protein